MTYRKLLWFLALVLFCNLDVSAKHYNYYHTPDVIKHAGLPVIYEVRSLPDKFAKEAVDNEIISRISLSVETYDGRLLSSLELNDKKEGNEVIVKICNEFIKENFLYLDYLSKPILPAFYQQKSKTANESAEEIKAGFGKYLAGNKDLTSKIRQLFELYVLSKGHIILNAGNITKEIISMEQLKSYAVRNVLPLEFGADGSIRTKICVLGEGYKDYIDDNAQLKAFTFFVVFNNRENPEFVKMLDKCKNISNKLKLSIEKETAIKRIQGVYWAIMFQDKYFENLLLKIYNEKKSYLPFELEN